MASRGEQFLKSTASDHAVFDACLVNAYRQYLNWTTARTPDGLPVTVEDLRSHVRGQLVEKLKTVEGLGVQDFSVRRPLVDNLAYLAVQTSGIDYHGQRLPVESMTGDIANNLRLTVSAKQIPITNDANPLRGHAMTRYQDAEVMEGGQKVIKKIPFHPIKENDRQILKYLTQGGSAKAQDAHLAKFLTEAAPFLMSVEGREVEYRLLELREKLRGVIGSRVILDDELRAKLLEVTMEDWFASYAERERAADIFTQVEEEVEAETAARDGQAVKQVFNREQEIVLDLCFRRPLAADTITPEMAAALIRRRPVMENLLTEAVTNKDRAFMQAVGKVYEQYFQRLGLSFGQLGHLSLIVASQDARYDADMYRNVLL